MVMGSWFGTEAYEAEQEEEEEEELASVGAFMGQQLTPPPSPAAQVFAQQVQQPVYGPPNPFTEPAAPLNPNAGGFRDPVFNPPNVQPGPNADPFGYLSDVPNFLLDQFMASQATVPISTGPNIGLGQPPTIQPYTMAELQTAEIPYAETLQGYAGQAGANLGSSVNTLTFGGSDFVLDDRLGIGSTEDVGRFLGEGAVPTNLMEGLIMGATLPLSAGPIDFLTGLPLDNAVGGLARAAMPNSTGFPGLGSPGMGPGSQWDESILGPVPSGPDLGQGPPMLGGEVPFQGRIETPFEERGLPSPPSLVDLNAPVRDIRILEPQMHEISQLWAQNQPNAPMEALSPTDMRTALYNAGLESNGTAQQIAARYAMADAQGIRLPLDTPPSDMPDAFDLARRGATPQSPANLTPTETLTGGGSPAVAPPATPELGSGPGTPPPASTIPLGSERLAADLQQRLAAGMHPSNAVDFERQIQLLREAEALSDSQLDAAANQAADQMSNNLGERAAQERYSMLLSEQQRRANERFPLGSPPPASPVARLDALEGRPSGQLPDGSPFVPGPRPSLPEPPESQVVRIAVSPDAVTPLDPNSLMGNRGAVELTDPSRARILGPGEMPAPGETLMYHGPGPGGIEGDLRAGLNMTPLEADAEAFRRIAARFESVIAAENLTPAQADFLRSPGGRAAAAQRGSAILGNAAPKAVRQEAARIAPDMGINPNKAQRIVDQWERAGHQTQDLGTSPKGLARLAAVVERPIEGGVTGNFSDPFITGLVQRQNDLEQSLALGTKLSPTERKGIVEAAVNARLAEHYASDPAGLTNAQRVLAEAEAKAAELATDFRHLNTFVERTKNTMFPLDLGFMGQNVLTGMRQGGLNTMVGVANRVAQALHLPVAVNLEAMTGLPRILAASNDGLRLGNVASGLKPDEGTLIRYVPGLSPIDKHAITPLIQKLTDAQYTGIGGFLKMMNYEGNLAVLGAMGRNIHDPTVRRQAAQITNNAWSSAALATTPGRQQAEKLLFTSPAFTRSQVAVLNDMAKALTPKASLDQRILAGTAILSNIAFATGVYVFLNDQFGIGPAQPNPLERGFGNITLPTRNSKGEHQVINLFPQRTFQSFAIRAADAIGDGDPDKLAEAFARLGAGRAGALPSGIARLAGGAGYDTQGQFHLGGMPWKERLNATIPAPVSLQNVVTGGATDSLTMGLEFAGLPNYSQGIHSERSLDRNEILKGDKTEVLGPVLGPLVQATSPNPRYAELGSREKEAVNARLDPEERQRQRETLIKQGDKWELAAKQRDEVKASYRPLFDDLDAKLKDGTLSPYEARILAKKLENHMYDKVEKIKFPESDSKFKQSPIQQAETQYRALRESAPKDEKGNPNYDALNKLQMSYLDAVARSKGEEFSQRLYENVKPRVNPDDSPLQQFYDTPEMKAAVKELFLKGDDPEYKAQFKLDNPDKDALLYAGGYSRFLLTPQAVEEYKKYSSVTPEINFTVGFNQDGYQTYARVINNASPEMAGLVRQYMGLPSGEGQFEKADFLREHPDLNVLLWQTGHSSKAYTLDAYYGMGGKPAEAPAPAPAQAPAIFGSTPPAPTASGAASTAPAAASLPSNVGPDGRTVAQITGTPYRSDAERAWYFESRGLPIPSTSAPAPRPSVSAAPRPGNLPEPTGARLPPVAPGEFRSEAASPQQRENFINAMIAPSRAYSQATGIPLSVYMAMGASESNWGRAPSVFGIKGVGSAGSANLATHEIYGGKRADINDQFAAYNSLDDAFKHFYDLTSSGRYAPAWNQYQQTGDWQGFLRGIVNAGYATDKNWPNSIINLAQHIEKTYPHINMR